MFGTSKNVSVIAEKMQVIGDIVGSGDFRVSGTIEGNLTASMKIEIDRTGMVQGNIEGYVVVVSGEVRGNVKANKLIIHNTGRISGDIKVGTITVDEGGRFHGKCEFMTTNHQVNEDQ